MAEELYIDTDWKRQAQEEKKKLADQAAAKAAAPAPAAGTSLSSAGQAVPPGAPSPRPAGRRGARELPPASFATLVQSLMTQAMYYLGDLAVGGQQGVNLDMAKHQLDTLDVLEDKVKNNLTADEQKLLDTALYDTRMRFVKVASQYL